MGINYKIKDKLILNIAIFFLVIAIYSAYQYIDMGRSLHRVHFIGYSALTGITVLVYLIKQWAEMKGIDLFGERDTKRYVHQPENVNTAGIALIWICSGIGGYFSLVFYKYFGTEVFGTMSIILMGISFTWGALWCFFKFYK